MITSNEYEVIDGYLLKAESATRSAYKNLPYMHPKAEELHDIRNQLTQIREWLQYEVDEAEE